MRLGTRLWPLLVLTLATEASAQVEWFLADDASSLVVYASARGTSPFEQQCVVGTVGPTPAPDYVAGYPGCPSEKLEPEHVGAWQRAVTAQSTYTRPERGTATLTTRATLGTMFDGSSARISGEVEAVLDQPAEFGALNSGVSLIKGVVRFRVLKGRSQDLVLKTNLEWTPGAISNRGAFQLRGIDADASAVNFVPRYSLLDAGGRSVEEYRATLRPGVYELTWHAVHQPFPPHAGRVTIDLDLEFTPWTCAEGSVDRDGDALPDVWEEVGVRLPSGVCVPREYVFDANGDARLDAGERPDPYRKDVYVEVDWMPGQEYTMTAFAPVVYAFANAPVDNPASPARPGGTRGIDLHVQLDEEASEFAAGNSAVCFRNEGATTLAIPTCTDTGFTAVRQRYFMPNAYRDPGIPLPAARTDYEPTRDEIRAARQRVFRYALLALVTDARSRLVGLAAGNDMVVSVSSAYATLGFETAEELALRYPCRNYDLMSFVFMHELGHTLGLLHGGHDEINNKPNYPSVMNYAHMFTFCTATSWNALNYSPTDLPDLDERALSEKAGVGVTDVSLVPGGRVVFGPRLDYDEFARRTRGVTLTSIAPPYNSNCVANARQTVGDLLPRPTAVATGPIDWNQNCRIDDDPVAADINGSDAGQSLMPFADEEPPVLEGWNDWENLRFDFRATKYYQGRYPE